MIVEGAAESSAISVLDISSNFEVPDPDCLAGETVLVDMSENIQLLPEEPSILLKWKYVEELLIAFLLLHMKCLFMDNFSKLHSSKTSEVARRYINLPFKGTLFDYAHVNACKECMSHDIIEEIANKIKRDEPQKCKHVLSFDNMYISQHLAYHKETGSNVGYCNLNDAEREINETGQAVCDELQPVDIVPLTATLTIMVKVVFSSTKEVTASYGVHDLSKEASFERQMRKEL
ncbi:hypothetical protein ONE63_004955 [Megalurothrips usitatus]|uniref:Transposable element P transposase-like RNase H domain-containing protein n=1 Tax=Megalurothrips usitatus TaxID=439358 RepID=A0AAV7X4W2_9NEOP|nr:hypothetical protein ONE63_004955 [Megalurothrips usitatus]